MISNFIFVKIYFFNYIIYQLCVLHFNRLSIMKLKIKFHLNPQRHQINLILFNHFRACKRYLIEEIHNFRVFNNRLMRLKDNKAERDPANHYLLRKKSQVNFLKIVPSSSKYLIVRN